MTSNVSAFSRIVANGHQAMQHVSSSPSKIPYGGFSPVRLQTGIRPRPSQAPDGLSAKPTFTHSIHAYTRSKLSSQRGDDPQRYSRFFRRRDKAQAGLPSISMKAIQSRGPWLTCGLCCPAGSSLTMASSETLDPSHRVMNYTMGSSVLWLCMDWHREAPQFAPRIPFHRAVFRTPADQAVALDCYFTAHSSLRPLRTGSASAIPPHRFEGGSCNEASKFA